MAEAEEGEQQGSSGRFGSMEVDGRPSGLPVGGHSKTLVPQFILWRLNLNPLSHAVCSLPSEPAQLRHGCTCHAQLAHGGLGWI